MGLDEILDRMLNNVAKYATQICFLDDSKGVLATITIDKQNHYFTGGEAVPKLMEYLQRKAIPDEKGVPTYLLPDSNFFVPKGQIGYFWRVNCFRLVEIEEERLQVNIDKLGQ